VPPVDTFVDAYVAQIRQTNDNDATPYVTAANELDLSGSSGELGAGDYYLNRVDLATPSNKQTLVLNTTEGNIRIAVRDWIHLRNTDLTVAGNGSVQIAVESQTTFTTPVTGTGSSQVHMHVGQDANVSTPGQRADRLVLFGPSDFSATIAGSNAGGGANNGKFTGVVFAPAGTSGSGSVFVKQADVYGLVMTGNLTAGQNGAVHYDRGIQNSLTDGSPLSELDYLHAAVHRVRVTSR
jgi:hypothetical protein